MKEFLTIFDGQVQTMLGEVFETKDAKTFCINKPRTIPYPLMESTKKGLSIELLEPRHYF